MLFYSGNKDISLEKNQEKALYWLKLSADKGCFNGAIMVGDMLKNKDAFHYYEKALKIKNSLSSTQSFLFLKAAGSMDYSAPYFDMVYEGLDGYSARDSKINDTFTIKPSRTIEFCELMQDLCKELNTDFSWGCESRTWCNQLYCNTNIRSASANP